MNREVLLDKIYNVTSDTFEKVALEVYQYQYGNNDLYRSFVDTLRKGKVVSRLEEIPMLPISFFKSHIIQSGKWKPEAIYRSSATTGMTRSQHYVRDEAMYKQLALAAFQQQYGSIDQFCVLGLLPGYLERQDSSLVAMVDHFITHSDCPFSGFYLDDYKALQQNIATARSVGKKIVLIGVSFALWEIAEKKWNLEDVIIMETGGMKGRGPEIPKPEFHKYLSTSLNVKHIHSEYGMTELLSQGYSQRDQRFEPSATMRVLISEITDPLTYQAYGKSGIINVIDLANLDTCSFITTEDMGSVLQDGSFYVLGRVDAAEIRGCNLLVSDLD